MFSIYISIYCHRLNYITLKKPLSDNLYKNELKNKSEIGKFSIKTNFK